MSYFRKLMACAMVTFIGNSNHLVEYCNCSCRSS